MTACGKYQVSGVLEGGASQLAVVQLGNGGTERIDTLDCLGGAFAFDVDYDKPVTILITDLARQGLQTGRFVRLMTVPGEHAIAADFAFDIDLAAFADIILRQVGQLAPGDDGVPFRQFARFTASVLVSFAGGQRNGGDGSATLQMSDFRILPYISDKNNFVD